MAMNKKITESYLREVAQLAKEKDLAALPPASELKGYYKFSEHFEQKIAEIYAMLDKPKTMSKATRRVLLIAAIIILLIVFAMSVGAIRERLYEMIWEDKSDHAVISFVSVIQEDGSYEEPPETLETLYCLSYIPWGFKQTQLNTDQLTNRSFVYENTLGDSIIFIQKIVNSSMTIDTEDVDYFVITDDEITYYCTRKNGTVSVFWVQNGYGFVLMTNLSVNKSIKIAKSLTPQ